jgi:putative transposase
MEDHMRSRRVLRDNAIYHVTARANRQEFILASDEVKHLFLDVLERARKKYHFVLKSFCIMENHIHLMIKPTQGSCLSEIMQWILSVFAVQFNHLFNLSGHVWYDRFHSRIIESLRYYLKVFEYIAENPVKAGMCADSGSYPFGALWFMLHGKYHLVDPPGSLLERYFPILRDK